jgi:hypothetical protein
MVRDGNMSPNISIDVRHHLFSLRLEACNDHDAYRLHTRCCGGVMLGLEYTTAPMVLPEPVRG